MAINITNQVAKSINSQQSQLARRSNAELGLNSGDEARETISSSNAAISNARISEKGWTNEAIEEMKARKSLLKLAEA